MAGLAAIQLVRPARNAGVAEGPRSLTMVHAVPDDVRSTLRRACYDCHSDSTRYPWYANVQPVGWWLQHHVNEGKRELNLSTFAAYPASRAVRKLHAIADEVSDRRMPLRSYLLIHGEARLTDAEARRLADWADELGDEIESR